MDFSAGTVEQLTINIEFEFPDHNSSFRNFGDGTKWISETKMTEEDEEETLGYLQDIEIMMANAIWKVVNYDESFTSPYLRLVFELDSLPYTSQSIADFVKGACTWAETSDFLESDRPTEVRNRSGNSNYFDPYTSHGVIIIPENIVGLLTLKD
jgi:hypothetical protein